MLHLMSWAESLGGALVLLALAGVLAAVLLFIHSVAEIFEDRNS
jgi:hypothetical protein